jgi:hypothetical protein
MENSTFDISNLNNFIQNANSSLECGVDCQNENQASKLQEDMIKAQQNLSTAPEEYEKATQAYLMFTKGEKEYSDYQETQFQKQADAMANKIKQEITKSIHILNKNIDLNSTLVKQLTYQTELTTEVQNVNTQVESDTWLSSMKIITNDRKSYYEEQVISSQLFYTLMLSYMYMALVFIYILTAISMKTNISWITHVLVVLFFVFFYTYGKYVFYFIIYLFNYIWAFLPKNVYSTLSDDTNYRKKTQTTSYYNF